MGHARTQKFFLKLYSLGIRTGKGMRTGTGKECASVLHSQVEKRKKKKGEKEKKRNKDRIKEGKKRMKDGEKKMMIRGCEN